ncbi:putative signal transduction protein containing sensor and EAL domain containing protein [Herbaspirillum sp. CF444]|uniref:EAL domain-containing protein n=1 Tax=Herbaspirillum sp. CF444 TaxID=1144319 RepID=UPI0002723980|nr:EAL domain-containing protein [Herbaspirillum sp. CF444]EJL94409.1 putative signal transduction protein containing sensor and EAL domain containing protein [Herbaspirillum sp. CF444]
MSRSRVIFVTVLLALVGAALPLIIMLYFSWTRAVSEEQNRLALYAQQAILRANISFSEIRSALHAIEPLNLKPCSDAHIARMRQLTVNTRSIEEIGYFRNGKLQCTSWGRSDKYIEQTPVDFTTPDGLQVTLRMTPAISLGNSMVAVQYGAHNVLTMPSRFVDVIVDAGIQMATATEQGYVLGDQNAPDPLLVRDIVANPVNSVDENYLVATVRASGLIATAIEPRSYLFKRLRQEQLVLLPIGAVIAALIVAAMVWGMRRRLSSLGELNVAIKRREFVVHYQPIVELRTGLCIGAEALVRWQRADGSMVRPDLFIPLAEESGLILPITDQVIDNVVKDLKQLLASDRNLHIAINLSADDIKTGRALTSVQAALKGSGIEAQQIWLEATERGFMDVNSARVTLTRARVAGHAVAIDDFGTGYSSLSYLQSLPLDALKIDKSFIDTIGTDSATSSVTPHIIGMAKTLRLKIVAEGVETQEQADYLLRHEVEFVQGWLYAKAMPAAEFIAYCRHNLALHQGIAPAHAMQPATPVSIDDDPPTSA